MRDWPEDSHLENGNYQNQCVHCGHTFIGYKRRVICKVCSLEKTIQHYQFMIIDVKSDRGVIDLVIAHTSATEALELAKATTKIESHLIQLVKVWTPDIPGVIYSNQEKGTIQSISEPL